MNSRVYCFVLFFLAFFLIFFPLFIYIGWVPAYRDGEYFYYPLFQYIQMTWQQQGMYPLWNPCEGFGIPLAANATSALLYPPTWLLLAPIPVWLTYNIYILGHLLLAGLTMGFVIRRWGGSWQAACLAATSYALSGTLVFLYSNQIFLVSAAWLPLGVWSIYESLNASTTSKRIRYGLICALSIALMTFGGDPQTGYHLGLIGGLLWLIRFISDFRSPISWNLRLWRSFVGLRTLILIGLCAGFLSAAVIIPQFKLIRESDRATSEITIADKARKESRRYEFSLPPWRVNEFVWGNMNGRSFPVFTRWIDMLPERENAIWIQSLYMGAFPFLLACFSLRFFRGSLKRRWISWLLLLSLLAAMGNYGPGWLVKEAGEGLGWEGASKIKPQWGGIYWFMESFLPGYASFRYPGKWLPITAAAISLLAGLYWDAVWNSVRVRGKSLTLIGGAFFVFALFSFLIPLGITRFVRHCMADEAFRKGFIFETYGPFRGYNPIWTFLSGIGFLVVGVLITMYLRKAGYWSSFQFGQTEQEYEDENENDGENDGENDSENENENDGKESCEARSVTCKADALGEKAMNNSETEPPSESTRTPVLLARWIPGVVLFLFAIELALFNHGLVLLVDTVDVKPFLNCPGPPRRYLAESYWIPDQFTRSLSPLRHTETANWNNRVLLFSHSFPNNAAQIGYNGTLRLLDYSVADEVASRNGIFIETGFYEYSIQKYKDPDPKKSHIKVKNPLPRAYMARNVDWIVRKPGEKKAQFYERATEKMIEVDKKKIRDLRTFAVAEGKKPATDFDGKTKFADRVRITEYNCNRAVIEADVKAPGLLLFLDQYWDEWNLQIEQKGVPGRRKAEIVRTDVMFRGTVLDKPGQYRLIYTFKPTSLYIGIILSLISWIIAASFLLFVLRNDRTTANGRNN